MANPHPTHRFRVGNPGGPGRPKGGGRLTKEIRKLMEETDEDGKTGAERLADVLFRLALKGNIRAATLIVERVEGRAPMQMDDASDEAVERMTIALQGILDKHAG